MVVTDLPRTLPAEPALIIDGFRQAGELIRRSAKPIVVMGNTLTDITPVGRDVAGQTGFPAVLGGIHHGLTALGRAVRWSQVHRTALAATAAAPAPASVPSPLTVPDEPAASWSEYRASAFVAEHGIPVVPSVLAADPIAATGSAGAWSRNFPATDGR